ncbi:MAG: serine/threonine protein kinase [Nitrospirae bacterium]|nr:serine/threonine protein kinase [Nitrospirota bacterium]
MSLRIPFGKYYLTEKIATGGMAELYRAKRVGVAGFEKLLVIKKILPHLSLHEEFVSMFINEAKIAAQLTHTNIVQIFDLGKIEDSYYIAMEYVWGKDLKAVLKKGKEKKLPVSMEHALQIISKACSALDYAHKKKDLKGSELNLIHRDVSPQNILVSYDGDVKLVDFGIAKAASKTSDTRTGVLKGKIAYMSPEQAWGRSIDRRSDIFSLGIVLYELLTGEMLFKGDTDLNTLEKVREAKIIPPAKLNKDIPKEIEDILLKALAKEPQERYQYASEMQNDLETYIHANKTMPGTLNLQNYVQTLFKEEMEAEAKALEEEDTVVSAHLEKTMAAPIGGEKKPAAKAVSKRVQAKKEEDERVSKKSEGSPIKYIIFVLLLFSIGALFFLRPELLLPVKNALSDYLKPSEPVVVSQGQIEQTQIVSEKPVERPAEKETIPIAQKAEEKKTERIEEKKELVSKQLGYGGIVIESTPSGAEIFLNNKETGLKTPASIQNLTANEGHNIRLTLKGYKEWSDTIIIKDNERITVTSKLKRLYASVLIDSKPEGAAIFINNQDTGKKTPTTFAEINPNEPYNIKLHLYGYEDWGRTITLKEEEYTTLSPKLSRLYGSLTINAIPWAEIYIEGESKGTTPLAGLRLPVGRYSVKLVNQELKIEKMVDVKIEPNETAKVVVDMKQ